MRTLSKIAASRTSTASTSVVAPSRDNYSNLMLDQFGSQSR